MFDDEFLSVNEFSPIHSLDRLACLVSCLVVDKRVCWLQRDISDLTESWKAVSQVGLSGIAGKFCDIDGCLIVSFFSLALCTSVWRRSSSSVIASAATSSSLVIMILRWWGFVSGLVFLTLSASFTKGVLVLVSRQWWVRHNLKVILFIN